MPRNAKLTRLDEAGLNSDGSPQQLIIDRRTLLGRFPKSKPPIEGGMHCVSVKDPSRRVSSMHAVFEPPVGTRERFSIWDHRSSNGTYVNEKMLLESAVELESGDVIGLGEQVKLAFEEYEQALRFNRALLVGHDGGDLQAVYNDIDALKNVLESRGFFGNTEMLVNTRATRRTIFQALDQLGRDSTDDGTSVFYFSGHGTQEGELCLGPERIEADELMHSLDNVRGKILMILDGCHTFTVTQARLPERSLLVGNITSAAEGPLTMFEGVDFTRTERPRRGYLTHSIVKALRQNPNRISVTDMVDALANDPRIATEQIVDYQAMTNVELAACNVPDFR